MAMAPISKATSLVFKVHRREPELISPAKPTPRELKKLSDIDDHILVREHVHGILFYRHNHSSMINNNNSDPVQMIRKALAETLVYYYPFAGRIREGPNGKLIVDCNGEGAMFVEADTDVALDDFGQYLHPPFPCLEELLFDTEGPLGFLDSPLLLLQVTRLKCGGFVFAVTFCHLMCDAASMTFFLRTLAELTRGANAPSIPPAWDRHLLSARVPPRVTHVHHEYDDDDEHDASDTIPQVQGYFFFGPREISAVRRLVPAKIHVTTSELLTSHLWRCRTIALRPLPDAETRVMIVVNARSICSNPPLPPGYYGNVVVSPVSITTARELTERPLEFAIRLVQAAKSSVTEEYVRSLADLLGTTGPRRLKLSDTFFVSDVRRMGWDDMDFGWGPPVYAGPPEGNTGALSLFVPCKNEDGEPGFVMSVILPEPAMTRFAEQLSGLSDKGVNNKTARSSL
ncbi:PREDICTED: (Z)-3-hexen-1-ol acetyltransferase-like [Tarenaya hassleriana]|uniref:(Z)-3-hexen-1-ol acetyltransferase-like n=1 Tax=Tarenaya hassleriana TaxID=28532 RepID=UPI00053C4155|nr:PREDICTED: (Z)-3-hexen-1-ol acetyltransferase-like [Tarenaya hassleriana]